ncbi:MAG TPA: aldose epimerase family protein [Gemmatimonadaceae bacterium]|nr:aldose epimerase family protein [Gemmatimonadaceae bacterium]
MPDGTPVEVFTLTNAHGVELCVLSYGGIIQSLRVPGRDGEPADVVLGFDDLAGYLGSSAYIGAIVGRYANRIARGRFTLDGREYQITLNDGPNALHGGVRGFDRVVWRAAPVQQAEGAAVMLEYESPDGDQGFPGTLSAQVTYTLTDRDELVVDYRASTTAATPVNLSQHSYFDLAGGTGRDILDHVLTIAAERFTPVNATLIPAGALAPVAGTPFDFRTPRPIGERIGQPDEQLRRARGYDHNFVLDGAGAGVRHAARVMHPASGRTLDVYTDQPGLQLYSGNFLDGSLRGKGERVYRRRAALCLETQHFPDSPNQPSFPSTVLRPGEEYRTRTVFAFSVVP